MNLHTATIRYNRAVNCCCCLNVDCMSWTWSDRTRSRISKKSFAALYEVLSSAGCMRMNLDIYTMYLHAPNEGILILFLLFQKVPAQISNAEWGSETLEKLFSGWATVCGSLHINYKQTEIVKKERKKERERNHLLLLSVLYTHLYIAMWLHWLRWKVASKI